MNIPLFDKKQNPVSSFATAEAILKKANPADSGRENFLKGMTYTPTQDTQRNRDNKTSDLIISFAEVRERNSIWDSLIEHIRDIKKSDDIDLSKFRIDDCYPDEYDSKAKEYENLGLSFRQSDPDCRTRVAINGISLVLRVKPKDRVKYTF